MTTIPHMHPSLARMLRFAREATAKSARPIQTLAQLRAHLDVSAQTMHNWKTRGVSRAAAILAAKEFNCSADGILDDLPPDWMDPQHSKEGGRSRGVLAQEMIHSPYTIAPTIPWEKIVAHSSLPTEFQVVLVDDAMAPKAPAGSKVRFRRDVQPAPGDAVLLVDGLGELYCRVYHGGLHGAWEARAPNAVYPTLHSREHALRVLAVFVGMDVSWGQLSR